MRNCIKVIIQKVGLKLQKQLDANLTAQKAQKIKGW